MSGASRTTTSRAAAQSRALDTTPVSHIGLAGVTERGPMYAEVSSYAEYQSLFGGPTLNSQAMDLGVLGLFAEAVPDNGRPAQVVLHVARAVHRTDPTDVATRTSAAGTLTLDTAAPGASRGLTESAVGPFSLTTGMTLVVAFETGGDQTFTITGAAAVRQSADGTFNVDTGDGYNITIGGVTAAWTIQAGEVATGGAATATELRNSLNAFFAAHSMPAVASVASAKVAVTTNKKGTGASINFSSAIASGANIGFTTGALAGTGNVADLSAVTVDEIVTIASGITNGTASNVASKLRFASATTGVLSTAQVKAASTADTACGFDNAVHTGSAGAAQSTLTVDGKTEGAYANALSVQIAAASNGLADHFNLYVLRGGVAVERFYNLNLDSASASYCVTVVNSGAGTQAASNLIALADEAATVASPGNLPAVGTFGPLTGGNDGLVSLDDNDFAGAMRLLDVVDQLHVLLVPGRATAATANAQVNYCEVIRGGLCFTIIDTPAGLTAAQMRTWWGSTASIRELSEMAAGYYPRIKVNNPSKAVFGQSATLTMGPAALLAGLYARMDASKDGGAFEAPASREKGILRTARGLEDGTDVGEESKRGLLFDDRINPIMSKGGQVYVDGSRTAKSTGPFPSVGESRGVLFLQFTIAEAVDPKRNQNNRPRLRNEIDMLVQPFMSRLTARECFATTVDADAWYFDIGDALNDAAEQAVGNVNARLGVATAKPGEFINIVFAPKA